MRIELLQLYHLGPLIAGFPAKVRFEPPYLSPELLFHCSFVTLECLNLLPETNLYSCQLSTFELLLSRSRLKALALSLTILFELP
jgi:hypothetical protein